MTWRDFINQEIEKLTMAKGQDPQYRGLSQAKLFSLFFNEIAEWLEFSKKIKLEELLFLLNEKIKAPDRRRIANFTLKRLEGTPKTRLIGTVSFWNLKIRINGNTLIPRPETEELARMAVQEIRKTANPVEMIEIGTGSGCLGLSVLKNIKRNIPATLSDIDGKAIAIAKKNALLNKIDQKRIKFVRSNLLNFIKNQDSIIYSNRELFVLANLPYVSEKEYLKLSPEVASQEPRGALVGGESGAELINELLDQISILILKKNPKKQITVLLEASPSTIPLIIKYLHRKKYPWLEKEGNDLSGKKRFLQLRSLV